MANIVTPFTLKIGWNDGKEGWFFPVLPDKITISHAGDGNDYNIVGLGPITTIKKPKLAEISFESFFPGGNYPFNGSIRHANAETGFPDPNAYVNDILKWQASGYPVRFVYVGRDNVNKESKIALPMSITGFERYEQAGSPGDIFYSLKLKEYVFHKASKITAVKDAAGNTVLKTSKPDRPDMRVPPTTWTIKPGENLSYVARMVYGDSGRWREIQKLNGLTDWDVMHLQIGKVLKLMPKK